MPYKVLVNASAGIVNWDIKTMRVSPLNLVDKALAHLKLVTEGPPNWSHDDALPHVMRWFDEGALAILKQFGEVRGSCADCFSVNSYNRDGGESGDAHTVIYVGHDGSREQLRKYLALLREGLSIFLACWRPIDGAVAPVIPPHIPAIVWQAEGCLIHWPGTQRRQSPLALAAAARVAAAGANIDAVLEEYDRAVKETVSSTPFDRQDVLLHATSVLEHDDGRWVLKFISAAEANRLWAQSKRALRDSVETAAAAAAAVATP